MGLFAASWTLVTAITVAPISAAQTAAEWNDLGVQYHDSGRFTDAERAYKASIREWKQGPAQGSKLGIALGNFAGLRLAQGRPSDAEKLYLEAIQVLTSSHGQDSPELATALCGLSDVYSETRRFPEAARTAERALFILDRGSPTPPLGVALFALAKAAWNLKRVEESERSLRRALRVFQLSSGSQHPTYASGLVCLAVLLSAKSPDEAGRLFRESIALLDQQLGPDHGFAGFALLEYARHLETTGSKREAKAVRRRGEAILAKFGSENQLGQTVDFKAFRRR